MRRNFSQSSVSGFSTVTDTVPAHIYNRIEQTQLGILWLYDLVVISKNNTQIICKFFMRRWLKLMDNCVKKRNNSAELYLLKMQSALHNYWHYIFHTVHSIPKNTVMSVIRIRRNCTDSRFSSSLWHTLFFFYERKGCPLFSFMTLHYLLVAE